MAARLQLKLGLVAEHDRLDDSPDTLVVVEPSVGSVARSKGQLHLLVTSRLSTRHALEATRLVADTIRNEYYYDESAGIRVCLQKAIATANKRLIHQADRLGLKSAGAHGPIGVGVGLNASTQLPLFTSWTTVLQFTFSGVFRVATQPVLMIFAPVARTLSSSSSM